MKRKTYRADTMKEARLKVKMDLGENAQILETRRVEEGGFFGFLTDTVIEVDACKTPEDRRNSHSKDNHSSTGRKRTDGKKNRSKSRGNRNRKQSPSTKSTNGRSPDTGGFERSVNEPVEPNFSPRDQAAQLIEQKNAEQNGSAEEHTYARPRPKANGATSTAEGSPSIKTGTVDDSVDETAGESTETLTRVLENTDRLTEKIDELANSLDGENKSMDQGTESYPGKLSDVYRDLLDEGVEAEHARDLMARTRRQLEPDEIDNHESIVNTVKQEISGEIEVANPLRTDRDETLLVPFVGPTGVGKTTTMAKLAAYFSVEEGQSVSFITFDTYRLAAVEQLRCYADILQVPVEAVMSEEEFQETLEEFRTDSDIVFIDTAGRSQFDDEKIGELKSMIETDQSVVTHLVVDATSRPEDLRSILDGFEPIGFDRLVVTKLDETRKYGSILSLIRRTDAPLSYFTNGQDVPDDLLRLDPEEIASLVAVSGEADEYDQPVSQSDLL